MDGWFARFLVISKHINLLQALRDDFSGLA
jgi:hypothetical protein